MGQLGMGVMLEMLGGNASTVDAHMAAMNKTIKSVVLADDVLTLTFTDDTVLRAFDNGQSCCEHRYMVTDDDLTKLAGSTFTGFELRQAPNESDDDGYGEHEVQFLLLNTSTGPVTFASHNEHNGYYGGFAIVLTSDPDMSPRA